MRASHLANIVVAFTTFGTTFLLFHGQQPLANLSPNQLENSQESVGEKSDRLAIKEEDEEEDQVLSPKIVRLEKYELPATDAASTPKLDDLSYLTDYAYSEVPPDKKPADIVLDVLKDIPIGEPIEEI
jgi:hypothetical protein